MARAIALLLSFLAACALVACDGDDDGSSSDDDDEAEVWSPAPGTTWQWQLSGAIDTSVDASMFDIDLFDAPQDVIDELRDDGKVVICYFSAGSREDWRPDADEFEPEDIGDPLEGWEGENWIDINSDNVRRIMRTRLDLAAEKGCDGVEPDNVDAYANDNGLGISYDDQLDYNKFLSEEAHDRGLSIGLKNDLDQVDDLLGWYDWALNEECLMYDECEALASFIGTGKAVFHVEYVEDQADGQEKSEEVCGDSSIEGFSTLIKTWDLDAWRIACP